MPDPLIVKRMRRQIAACALGALLLAPAVAVAQSATPQPVFEDAELVVAKATVQAVDENKRKLTLKTLDGRTLVLKAGPEVSNFAQVKPGDVVKAAFYESIALDIRQPGAGGPGVSAAAEAMRAKPKTLPGGAVVEAVAFTSEIVGIEPGDNAIVVIDPAGVVQTIQVTNPEYQALLPTLNVGDKIDVVVTEGLAVGIEPAN